MKKTEGFGTAWILGGLGILVSGVSGCSAADAVSDRGERDERDESVASASQALNQSAHPSSTRWVSASHGNDKAPNGAASDCQVRARPCATIQHAVDVAADGDQVNVDTGAYGENVVITRAITITGEGRRTVLHPAISAPRPCTTDSLCGGAASTILLVRASHVRIASLTLDGDSPALTSGVVVGKADVDARNGIVTDYAAGRFDGLTVEDVRVENVYSRGIEASSGGTFSIRHNHLRNVAGDEGSIALFNFAGSGIFEGNTVNDANDGIAVNHSTGTIVRGNVIRGSKSGVHSDNGGDGANAIADVLEDNEVTNCAEGGYGVWVFVPYVAPSVRSNTITGCTVGLALFGQGAAARTTFTGNTVDARGVAGTIGLLVTTDQLGFGAANASADSRGNTLARAEVGLLVAESGGQTADVDAECDAIEHNTVGVQTASAATHLNDDAIVHNGVGVDASDVTTGSVDATRSYWGCTNGPGGHGCDTVKGNVDASSPKKNAPSCTNL